MAIELPPDQDKPGVVIPPPLLFVVPVLIALALERFFPTSLAQGSVRWLGGGLLLATGLGLTIAGFVTQRRAGTDPIPFHPTTRIVTYGLYRLSRNPMYVGFAVGTIGVALLCDSWWLLLAAIAGFILVDRLIVPCEEKYLERKFGEEYLSYKRSVRRWL